MSTTLSERALAYVRESGDELVELIKTLSAIPAPSNDEERRAIFCRDWLIRAGAKDVSIDSALNTVCRVGDDGKNPLLVFMAHTDTVFPDTQPFVPETRGNQLCCPGVGDDTANLAILLLCARYVIREQLAGEHGVLFVANAGEEGLGNLKGCRRLMEDYGHRVRQVVSFDSGIGYVCNDAVGSTRYRIRLTAQGGHSFSRFGNTNAIHLLSRLVVDLYGIQPPAIGDSRTTYNVGLISGGNSVNSIAQHAEMTYEIRSTHRECLAQMEARLEEILSRHRASAEDISVEILGRRPCMGEVDPDAQRQLEERIGEIIQRLTGKPAVFGPSSTDCNIPFSMGIPAICTGGYVGGLAHTRDEWIDLSSLPLGFEILLSLVCSYFK